MDKSNGIMGSEKGMSPRKAMASGMGDGGGNFGLEKPAMGAGMHPDRTARTGEKPHMMDGDRAIGDAVHHTKGQLPAQAAPDHGPTHVGGYGAGWRRGGKA